MIAVDCSISLISLLAFLATSLLNSRPILTASQTGEFE
eukprot:CAMPEP_0172566732 /NCGR_PEP_ID=MMETSP1067-20121228/113044_1 /TAXON_ID=265564 ORGANISM="Thalassiosira punctigera, Strain Tpunct2005C2" /NCGR_SAMPLE_ID=MMETSP1067 /ASSEMBLY_ACC=CAM_ASM_000444 /LENGTH=37 /DNA_ID= /DNA_START= /DNA_END= /DNA_ORIENTATION=